MPRVVHPAKCYIPPTLLDNDAILKYSLVVVLHPDLDSYIADLEHVGDFIESNVHVRVRIELLNDRAFLLYIDKDYPLEDRICKGELIQWTPKYGSMGCVVTQLFPLQIVASLSILSSVLVTECVICQ
jgi:hypothetical protein